MSSFNKSFPKILHFCFLKILLSVAPLFHNQFQLKIAKILHNVQHTFLILVPRQLDLIKKYSQFIFFLCRIGSKTPSKCSNHIMEIDAIRNKTAGFRVLGISVHIFWFTGSNVRQLHLLLFPPWCFFKKI